MKKLLTIAALIGAGAVSFGQGYVAFFNASNSRISQNTNSSTSGGSGAALQPVAAPFSYWYTLLWAPTTLTTVSTTSDPTLNGWTWAGAAAYGTNNPTAGRMSAYGFDGAGAAVQGVASGATANYVVVGWSSNIGSTWAQAQAWWNNGNPGSHIVGTEYFGISALVAQNIAASPAGGPYN